MFSPNECVGANVFGGGVSRFRNAAERLTPLRYNTFVYRIPRLPHSSFTAEP
jgi:hypothetical protein